MSGALSQLTPAQFDGTNPAAIGLTEAPQAGMRAPSIEDGVGALSKLFPTDGRNEDLAMAAAFGAPTKTGSLTEAMGNAAGAQYQARQDHAKLQAQYLPIIMNAMQNQHQANKPVVVGRSLLDPNTGAMRGQDATWQQERQENREMREVELRAKLADAAASRAEKIEAQRQLQQMQIEARQDMARLAASLRTAPAPTLATIADPNDPGRSIVVDARTGQKIGAAPGDKSPNAKAAYNSGLKALERDDKDIAAASAVEQAAKEWLALNEKVSTGPIAGRRPISFDDDYQRLQQLESFLAANNFKPGQGAISNFERDLIKGSGPTTTKNKGANTDTAKIMIGAAQNARERADYREWFFQNKGNILGADRAWNDYIEKNPRYVKDEKSGRVVENTKRADWMDHFSRTPPWKNEPSTGGATGSFDSPDGKFKILGKE